ncbi:hypothetical protein QUW13_03845 [Enterococcus hirae]|jgi:hypothetical protein|nr:hypothetical protein [Enterococcaceae bacterium]MCI1920018.1 hypothetical protein [Enterococcaceae bacterium]MDM8213011.1 hypothetical protein [Enterococcus hirae]
MVNKNKEILPLVNEDVHGPFVTIMLNTHVGHTAVDQDVIRFKNFAKESKKRFLKKFPERDWQAYQKQIDALTDDQKFWRSATKSVAIVFSPETHVFRLTIPVDDQYYVGDLPYLLAFIKNGQFNYEYDLLALARDNFKLYHVANKTLKEIELPEDAPDTIVKALGDQLTGDELNYSIKAGSGNGSSAGKEGLAYHGVNTKDEEVDIDWTNFFQVVDKYVKENYSSNDKAPLYLYALPESITRFKKLTKNPYYSPDAALESSPVPINGNGSEGIIEKIAEQLSKKEIAEYTKLMDRKFINELVDIDQAAKDGKVSHLFIATSNLADGFGEDPDTEYDRREELNRITADVLKSGGEVFVLDQHDAPDENSLLAILRY